MALIKRIQEQNVPSRELYFMSECVEKKKQMLHLVVFFFLSFVFALCLNSSYQHFTKAFRLVAGRNADPHPEHIYMYSTPLHNFMHTQSHAQAYYCILSWVMLNTHPWKDSNIWCKHTNKLFIDCIQACVFIPLVNTFTVFPF